MIKANGENSTTIEPGLPSANSTQILTKCDICKELLNVTSLDCTDCKKSVHVSCLPEDQRQKGSLWTCDSCISNRLISSQDKKKSDASDRGSRRSSSSSKSSVRKRRELLLQKLEEEKALKMKEIQKELQLEKEFLEKKYRVLEELASSDDEDVESVAGGVNNKNVESWLNAADKDKADKEKADKDKADKDKEEVNKLSKQLESLEVAQAKRYSIRFLRQDIQTELIPGAQSVNPTYQGPNMDRQVDDMNGESRCIQPQDIRRELNPGAQSFYPTYQGIGVGQVDDTNGESRRLFREDIAARRETRALPIFAGDFCDWPIFYSAFVSTTSRCKFDNYENLARLREALKGEARESVEALLTHENNVPELISTLKMLYGRKDHIIMSLIRKVKSTKNVKIDNLTSLISFHSSVSNLVASINSFEMTSHLENPCLLQELVEKLPNELKLDWGIHKLLKSRGNLSNFNEWLKLKAEAVCEVRSFEIKDVGSEVKTTKIKSKSYLNVHESVEASVSEEDDSKKFDEDIQKCIICGSSCISIESCPKFVSSKHSRRKRFARKLQLCYLCLKRHNFRTCKSTKVCAIENCSIRHHELLHNSDYKPRGNGTNVNENSTTESSNAVLAMSDNSRCSKVLYRIAPITLHGNGKTLNTFAFLDEGSALTLLDDTVAKVLNLHGELNPLCLRWTGNVTRMESESEVVLLNVSSRVDEQQFVLINVRTVSNLGLPIQTLDESLIRSQIHLKDLPILSYYGAQPKILIGLNNCKLGISQTVRYAHDSGLVATKTVLGWIVHGVSGKKSGFIPEPSLNVHQCDCDIHNMVKGHFSLENLGVSSRITELPSLEEERAVELLKKISRKVGERFETSLLWVDDNVTLPNNYDMVVKRHMSLERRLSKDPELAVILRKTIQEYLDKGYSRILTKTESLELHPRLWYLPIFRLSMKTNQEK